jgi:hypothetical protein
MNGYKALWTLHTTRRTRDAAAKEMSRLRASVGANVLLTRAFDPDGVDVWLVWYDRRNDDGSDPAAESKEVGRV